MIPRILSNFLSFSLIFLSFELSSQSIPNANDIDNLSDDQIKTFVQRARATGMSQSQLEDLARQRGMSNADIAKLKARIYRVDLGLQNEVESELSENMSRLRDNPIDPSKTLKASSEAATDDKLESLATEIEVFGINMFKLEGKGTFGGLLNMPTPKNYILGAGDEIIVDIFGASEITYRQEVSPDGQIVIEGIGPIQVSGISVEQAKSRIFQKLTNIYSGLKGQSPNTFAQVTVGNIRTIQVSVVGFVKKPGTYTLNSFSSILNVLHMAEGVTEKGSLRSIRLVRDGKSRASLDVYKYLFSPEEVENIILQDGDQVIVDPFINRVSLTGAVKNPAKYELIGDETFVDLLNYSGGFDGSAYTKSISIERKNGRMKSIVTITEETFGSEVLRNGDSINIGTVINRFDNRINISGAVMRPGNYELEKEMMLSDLIKKAEGLREDAFKGRGNIFRQKKDLTLKNIAFNVEEIVNGSQDILLQKEDHIIIPSIFDLRRELSIQIGGEVGKPGTYPYLDQMTVEDLINIAGGFKESANKSVVEVARQISYDQKEIGRSSEIFTFEINENLGLTDEASSFQLQPFDIILIKRSSFFQEQKLVRVEGEVLYPGYYTLENRDDKISDLIKRAGGLTEYAYAHGATILRQTELYEFPFDSSLYADNAQLEADKYRAKRLKELQQRDTENEIDLLGQFESIGIDLEALLKSPGSKFDIILNEGDIISVPKQLQTVHIRGNVLYPNSILYEPGMSFKEAISKAGGFAVDAKPGKSYVIYANGSAQRTKKILFFKNYPPLEPGAEIIVPKIFRERQPLNAQSIIGITSSLATLVLVITQIRQSN